MRTPGSIRRSPGKGLGRRTGGRRIYVTIIKFIAPAALVGLMLLSGWVFAVSSRSRPHRHHPKLALLATRRTNSQTACSRLYVCRYKMSFSPGFVDHKSEAQSISTVKAKTASNDDIKNNNIDNKNNGTVETLWQVTDPTMGSTQHQGEKIEEDASLGTHSQEGGAGDESREDIARRGSLEETEDDSAALLAEEHENASSLDEALSLLSTCDSFDCLQGAHSALAGRTHFNFPHFFLAGWQKCATSSVNAHLRLHPEYLPSTVKESHYFTVCKHTPTSKNCKAKNDADYIRGFLRVEEAAAGRLDKVTVDSSVDYAWRGQPLAEELHGLFPWSKVVMILREPISRIISYTRMYTERNITVTGGAVKGCLQGQSLYSCLLAQFDPTCTNSNYSVPLEGWLRTFPPDQVHIVQFEELQSDPDGTLGELKRFLGLNPDLPKKHLWNTNDRKKAGGAPIRREEYEALLRLARPDAERTATMLQHYLMKDRDEWMRRWEAVWNGILDTCDASGNCLVNSN